MKKKTRRTFSDAKKKAILREAIRERSVAKVLARHRLGDGAFYRWQKRFMPNWEEVFKPKMDTRRHAEESKPRVEVRRGTNLVDLARGHLREAQFEVKRWQRVLVLLVGKT